MKNETKLKIFSLKNIKIDNNLFFSFHNNENNEKIFKILKSENRNFYYHTDIKKPQNIKDINKYIESGKIFFDIFYKNEFIGLIEFCLEKNYLSYWVSTRFQNKGIMSKALKKVSDSFLNLGFQKVFVHIKEENNASIRVAEKSGFELVERKIFDKDDVMLLFSKTKE